MQRVESEPNQSDRVRPKHSKRDRLIQVRCAAVHRKLQRHGRMAPPPRIEMHTVLFCSGPLGSQIPTQHSIFVFGQRVKASARVDKTSTTHTYLGCRPPASCSRQARYQGSSVGVCHRKGIRTGRGVHIS
jgi:hypothetical protein